MAKRVFNVAKELGVTSKAIVEKCHAEGIPEDVIKNHMSSVSAGLEATIHSWFGDAQVGDTAVETAEKVNLEKARAKPRRAKSKSESEVEVSQKNILHLLIQPDGTVQVKRGENPQIQTATANQIGAIWRTEFAANPNLIAAVKTHPNASYRNMIYLIDQLQAEQADNIALQLMEE